LDELFPLRRPDPSGLKRRLAHLCARLAQEICQEAFFLDPEVTCHWVETVAGKSWSSVISPKPNFERAEPGGAIAVGTSGDYMTAPPSDHRATRSLSRSGELIVRPQGMWVRLHARKQLLPLCDVKGDDVSWHWQAHPPIVVTGSQSGLFTVGPTLVYGKDREPIRVQPTPVGVAQRIQTAVCTIEKAWPLGGQLLSLLTSRIIPLRARGVVSFSYRHRPGLSFINCFDRDDLDLIDDLIHENSHHHLNLLLRKQVLYRGDQNRDIFYSPWRRSLRPIRGILHATFTFTMGALLFERLSSWAETKQGMKQWKEAGLTQRDLMRARFRCLEEIESVRYSIQDLDFAGAHLKWITGSGARLVRQLEEEIGKAEQRIARYRNTILASTFGPALRKHIKELQQARQTYGPVRLSKA
jgi:HEXXH motif-containing protein